MTTIKADRPLGPKPVWPNYAKDNLVKVPSHEKKQQLGKDQFLKILMTQMGNQDPLSPLQNHELIAQMAQFSSVEQLTKISTQINSMQSSIGMSSNLIGKQISWIVPGQQQTDGSVGQGELKSGVVESILVKDGKPYANVDGAQIEIEKIAEIRDAAKSAPAPSAGNSPTTDTKGGATAPANGTNGGLTP
ncbi:flagellar hook capping FlgD N-terminal domain-containing protein [Paenibacillus sp. 481]|uniref:flagellar hook capping FlgD N-terminal domain-containing protein n=1 Tax=Paenibacillus sp. 481 TaxID=2835869 RepID=UPI001E4979AF|nr:flagellar hook capping FlgD N-terminal domain-containing protein [Paenibacillus sp. 481]UHA73933.1 flagellar hook capping protein [Paenibacillus sp. 481]